MSERITVRHLRNMAARLNNLAGTPMIGWKFIDGKNVAQVGHFTIDCAYGGYRLVQLDNECGGESNFGSSYRMTARECYYVMLGVEAAFEWAQRHPISKEVR